MKSKSLSALRRQGSPAAVIVGLVLLFCDTPQRLSDLQEPVASAKAQGTRAPSGSGRTMSTTGNCSPIVADSTANKIAVTLNCSFGGGSFNVELIRATLACNNLVERQDMADGQKWRGRAVDGARDLFKRLQTYDDEFVYVDLVVPVGGGGCGLSDVRDKRFPKWGVVYQLDLDGFTGNHTAYQYGYQIDFDRPVEELAPEGGGKIRKSTLLFPKDDNAFFSARFGSFMVLEGLAKVKISHVQGFQFIEFVPAVPIGGLAEHYTKFKRYMKETYQK